MNLMATAPSRRLDNPHLDYGAATCADEAGDEQLLLQFLEGDAEGSADAFRSLVCRHGPMVMGVCRHVLHQEHDAEDAFQATFLTLSRKACTIRDRRVLAAWLYEVAYRIAVRARAGSVRRRQQEKEGMAMTATTFRPDQENQAAWNELRPVLHDEINRLPEKYRVPVILSYLEGRTNEEVANLLDWPVGTVKGRLSRARDMLRSRLVRRGLALSAAFLCTSLSQGVIFAEVVPESLVDSTVRRGMRARWDATGGPDPDPSDLPQDPISPLQAGPDSRLAATKLIRRFADSRAVFALAVILAVGSLVAAFIATDPVLSMRMQMKVQGFWTRLCH
jgi:RNA polymerase sigma factor (sigma-70 family)